MRGSFTGPLAGTTLQISRLTAATVGARNTGQKRGVAARTRSEAEKQVSQSPGGRNPRFSRSKRGCARTENGSSGGRLSAESLGALIFDDAIGDTGGEEGGGSEHVKGLSLKSAVGYQGRAGR